MEVHWPGHPNPVRSAFRVSHPLDGLLPPMLSDPKAGTTRGVIGPPEPYPFAEPHASRRRDPHAVSDIACSCSEDQEVTMPRDSRALLSAKIRTDGKPGPAAAAALLGFSPFRSVNHRPGREPVARLHPDVPQKIRPEGLKLLGDPGFPGPWETGFRRTWSDSIRASTRTCPRVLPKTVMS